MEDNSTSQDQGYDYYYDSNSTFDYYDYSNSTYDYYDYSNSTYDYYDYSTVDYYDYSNSTVDYYDYSNITFDYSNEYQYYQNLDLAVKVMTWIIICIGLPLTLLAIYFLYSEVRNGHVAPIYVINLFISDLIQLFCIIVQVAPNVDIRIIHIRSCIYRYCLAASVGFMVCIALERYLVIAWPLWYRFRRTIKISVLVCVVVWVIPLFDLLPFLLWGDLKAIAIIWSIFLLLPLPLLVFFLGGTIKALSASTVPSDEKRRILGVLVLVLLIYTLLFLPKITVFLTFTHNITFSRLSNILVRLNPIADLVLYVFMRKGTTDKLLAFVCCCRTDSNDVSIST